MLYFVKYYAIIVHKYGAPFVSKVNIKFIHLTIALLYKVCVVLYKVCVVLYKVCIYFIKYTLYFINRHTLQCYVLTL